MLNHRPRPLLPKLHCLRDLVPAPLFGVLSPSSAPCISSGWLAPGTPGIVRFVLGVYDAAPALALSPGLGSGPLQVKYPGALFPHVCDNFIARHPPLP
jgi:hypothetical protein